MAGVAGKSGGARMGAGRKPTRDKYPQQVEAAEDSIAADLALITKNLKEIANGKTKATKEIWVPAGTVIVETTLTYPATGQAQVNSMGRPLQGKQSLFPNKKPDELVCIRREVIIDGKDKLTNIYLADRVMGKPAAGTNEPVEFDPDDVTDALLKIEALMTAHVTDPDAQKEIAAHIRTLAEGLSTED